MLQPPNDSEAAIVATLMPAPYTAIVRGADESTGNALVELYTLNWDGRGSSASRVRCEKACVTVVNPG